ncbi:MAG: DegV family protein [Clostridia bacterium]
MIWFIVDSTFGIEKIYAEKNNVKIVNLRLNLDEKVYEEGTEQEWDTFFEAFEKSKSFPTTSQPNPQDYINAIESIRLEDPTSKIVVLTISETLSGTINSAKLACKNYKDIVIFDSGTTSVSARVAFEEIVNYSKDKTFEETVKAIPTILKNVYIYFIPKTMEYLKRGGRVGLLASVVATVLSIKPIFCFHYGKVSVPKKAIGIKMAIASAVGLVPQTFKRITACYIHSKENLPILLEKLTERFSLKKLEAFAVSPVLGSHIGMGTIGVIYLNNYTL